MAFAIAIIIGVSGSGKTTVGRQLAAEMDWPFFEGDDFHPQSNITKMTQGIPLTDADRQPWLQEIHCLIVDLSKQGQSAVITCSALKQTYRDTLRGDQQAVKFVYLKVEAERVQQRLQQRQNHFMPPRLLKSQLDTLEAPQADPQTVLPVDAHQLISVTVQQIQNWLLAVAAR